MRKQPPSLPPAVRERENDKLITQVREYKLITPLFGGGVKPLEADPVTIIRGSEIRAQLRFWWRACRGGQFSNVEDLKKAEDAIWGKAHKKGEEALKHDETVQIVVEVLAKGVAKIPFPKKRQFKYNPDSGVPQYAAFPLQPSQKERESEDPREREVQEGVSFKLTLSFPASHRSEIAAALWAWETFGGIGGRTRRGFGALRCISIEENGRQWKPELAPVNDVEGWIKKRLTEFGIQGRAPAGCPYLSPTMQMESTKAYGSSKDCWKDIVDTLKRFRQRQGWPEKEAIRAISSSSPDQQQSKRYKFPKAPFGLPIIFDPDDKKLTLEGATDGKDRLASPLILRPLACQAEKIGVAQKEGNENFVGLAVLLEGRGLPPGGLQLVTKDSAGKSQPYPIQIETGFTSEVATGIRISNQQQDVLLAFMNYFRNVFSRNKVENRPGKDHRNDRRNDIRKDRRRK
jgi:CRISPR-associated protein Cmr1